MQRKDKEDKAVKEQQRDRNTENRIECFFTYEDGGDTGRTEA